MYCIIYDLLLRIVHYCYRGIIKTNPLSADRAGKRVYGLRQRIETSYGKEAVQLAPLRTDSSQTIKRRELDWFLFAQSLG